MKKIYLIAFALILVLMVAGCSGTSKMPKDVPPPAPVEETQPAPEAATQAVIETPVEQEPTIISESLPVSSLDADLDQKFSYAYAHLLTSGLIEQNMLLEVPPFILGSSTFFNGEEPIFTDEEINGAFEQYQALLDGVMSEEEFSAVQENGYSMKYLFSYGYGYVVQFNLQTQGIIVSLDDFHDGVSDAFAQIPLDMSDEEIDLLFNAYIQKLNTQYEEVYSQLATTNLAEAEAFLAENGQREDVMTTDSGLQYEIMSEGSGETPKVTDTVKVDYQITFLDGSVGDNSYARGEPAVFALENLIPGFIEGATLMPVGSHYRFFIHPDAAYGEAGNEMIPPNALLIFDVELLEIVQTSAQ
ncbi:MAG: hypothetical protein EOM67_07155 [Spirochaetia bacterium]|nr:hypothetical protein [Spirochaetia bacterium]